MAKKRKPRIFGCKCCKRPFYTLQVPPYTQGVGRKSFLFYKTQTSSGSYGLLCVDCFNDPTISFEKIINYYTHKSEYDHEDFKEEEVEMIIDGLIEETKVNPAFRNKYLMLDRNDKLKELFGD